ncbi:hypothetical protein PAXRUDRAFT_770962 [Paxillus rubicundulus Ve08.2h10]|uniref:Uncharacterized protein n=1 Tax=Paxillus rubicundulus Ve08.2h10 TaxID=930991 RepID=A0A0D0DL44_9AGAM|nr:hypothetical protein PAXRUDRAFT_770962 [Paxillus rubicundulus Ve08.2h10]
MMPEKCKPRKKPTKYTWSAKRQKVNDAPNTSTQPAKSTSCQNLTLGDWLTIYAYINSHPSISQLDVVTHFQTLRTGALVFTQSMLS